MIIQGWMGLSFIAKKREMGLTRMSLATKRHEIRKLEEEAEGRASPSPPIPTPAEDATDAIIKHCEGCHEGWYDGCYDGGLS